MADLLPPIVVELLSKSDAFRSGLTEARGEMGGFAADMDKATSKVAASEEAMAVRGGKAARDLEGAHADLEGKSSGFASRMQGMFGHLSSVMGSWGIPFGESVGKMGESIGEAELRGKGFSQSMQEVGKVATLGIVGALGVAAGESIHLAETFQQSTASLAAHAGISVAAAQSIGQAFLSTAGQTTFSAQEMESAFAPLAGQFQTMYGHALNAKDSLTFMKAAMDAAEASGAPLAQTAQAVASAMMVYHLSVGQASDASDVMWNTSRALGISMNDLGTNLQRLEPRIAGSGMSLQQTGAFMVELAKEAGNGRQAMRLAGTSIQNLISPSTSAQKAMAQMGVSLTDSNGKFIGVRAAIGELHDAFAKLPGDQASIAAGQELVNAQNEMAKLKAEGQTKAVKAQEQALNAHIAVLKQQAGQLSTNSAMQAIFGRNANLMASLIAGGVPAFDAAANAVSKQGTAEKAAETQAKTFHGTMEKLKSTGEDLGVEFGNFLIPKLQDLMSVTAGVVNWFMQHKAIAEALAATIGGVLTVAVGAFTINKIAGLISGVKDAAKEMQSFAGTITNVSATVLEKLGIMDSETAAKMRSIGQSWQQKKAAVTTAQQQESGQVTGSAAQEQEGVTNSAATAERDASASFEGKAATVEAAQEQETTEVTASASTEAADVSADMAAVEADFGAASATAAADAATIEGDAVAAESAAAGAGGLGITSGAGLAGTGTVAGGIGGIAAITGYGLYLGANPSAISAGAAYSDSFGMPAQGGLPQALKAAAPYLSTFTGQNAKALAGGMGDLSGLTGLKKGAAGGFIDHPTLLLAGEAGPEMLLPLNDPQRMASLIGRAATPLPSNGAPQSPSASSGPVSHTQNITVNMTGAATDPHQTAQELGWILRPYLVGT